MLDEATQYRLLKTLEEKPDVTQRELASLMGISLGKANYCLNALIKKGWVKMDNFRRSPDKKAYAYLLTPRGLDQKARVTVQFLKLKMAEYESLRVEIEVLRSEVEADKVNL